MLNVGRLIGEQCDNIKYLSNPQESKEGGEIDSIDRNQVVMWWI